MPNGVTHEKKGNKRPFVDDGLVLLTVYFSFSSFVKRILKLDFICSNLFFFSDILIYHDFLLGKKRKGDGMRGVPGTEAS